MKLKDLFEQFKQQRIIDDDITIPSNKKTLVGYKHKGIPIAGAKVSGFFKCANVIITSLEGAPSYVGNYFSCWNTNITSLLGAPSYVGGTFNCSYTKITSLQNIHKQIKHIGGVLYISNTIRSDMLGVMRIEGLMRVHFEGGSPQQTQAALIINKHLQGNRNIHECQEELIEAGLKEFARL